MPRRPGRCSTSFAARAPRCRRETPCSRSRRTANKSNEGEPAVQTLGEAKMKKAVALALPVKSSLGAFVLALSVAPCWAADDKPPPPFTGHIDLVSKYILRGASTTYGNSRPGLGNQ